MTSDFRWKRVGYLRLLVPLTETAREVLSASHQPLIFGGISVDPDCITDLQEYLSQSGFTFHQ